MTPGGYAFPRNSRSRRLERARTVLATSCLVVLLAACSSDSKSSDSSEPIQDLDLTGFCVGDVEPNGQTVRLAAGTPLIVHLIPDGCFSSSCTEIVVSECTIQGTNPFEVTGTIKVRALSGDRECTADCGGAGTARCEGAFLEAGFNTVQMGDLSVTIDVPSEPNAFEVCAPPDAP